MSSTFNATGTNHRDCPICYRVGSLSGDRVDGAEMTCTGCLARFSYTKESFTQAATLTRIPAPDLREPLNNVCGRCGRRACRCGFDNGRDRRADR